MPGTLGTSPELEITIGTTREWRDAELSPLFELKRTRTRRPPSWNLFAKKPITPSDQLTPYQRWKADNEKSAA